MVSPRKLPTTGVAGVVHLGRAADLGEPAVEHDRHLVGERECLGLVMGHEHGRGPARREGGQGRLAGGGAERGVEGRERFVEQYDGRLARKRSGESDALLLSAGQLVGAASRQVGGESDKLSSRGDLGRVEARPGGARTECCR